VVGHRRLRAFDRWWSGAKGAYQMDYTDCRLLIATEISLPQCTCGSMMLSTSFKCPAMCVPLHRCISSIRPARHRTGAAGESSLSLIRLFISCSRKVALQSPKETRTRRRAVGGCRTSSDRNRRALFRNCCAVFQDGPSDAGPGIPWLGTKDPTCVLISSDHEVIAGCPAYSVSHRGWHTR
jgi:hypothetical protein